MPTQAGPIGVFNEWGKLREVLVGDSSRCVFPRWSPDWGRYHGFKTMLHGLEGVSLQQAMPERAKGMMEQTEALASVLEEHGVVVHRPRPLTDIEIAASPVGLINQFVRDAQIVIGKHVIETNLRMMFRCKEHLAYEQFFRARLSEDPGARQVRMPDTTRSYRARRKMTSSMIRGPSLRVAIRLCWARIFWSGFRRSPPAQPAQPGCSGIWNRKVTGCTSCR